MYIMLYLFLLSVLILLAYNKFRSFFNFVSVFSGIWFIFGIISCLGMYGMRKPSLTTHICVWLFVVSVSCLFLMFCKNENKALKDISHLSDRNGKIICILTYILLSPLFIKILNKYIQTGDFSEVRLYYFSGTVFNSMIQDVLFRTFPIGMLEAIVIYYVFLSFDKRQYRLLVYAIFNSLLITFINGGRYGIMLLIYSIVILLMTNNFKIGKLTINRRYKKRIRNIAVLSMGIMFFITVIRGQAVLKSVIMYFSGSLSYLDYIISNPSVFALDKPTNGYLTFGVITEPIVLILKILGLTSIKVPSYEFNIYCQQYYNIGIGTSKVLINANTSIIYYFLRDFGFSGIFIGAIFVCSITIYSYNKWKARGNKFYGMIFVYMCYTLFNSLMTYQFFSTMPLFIFFTLYLLNDHTSRTKSRSRRISI